MSKKEEVKRVAKKTGLGRGLNSLLGENQFGQQSQEGATKRVPFAEQTNNTLQQGFQGEQTSQVIEPTVPANMRIWEIAIEKIVANKDQPRKVFEKEPLMSLAASIKEKGIIQPITVRKLANGNFEIVAGERRWRAAQSAGMSQVPVIIKQSDNQQALEVALIENIQRQDLNPVEEAEAYFNLIKKYRLTQQQLADRLGKERVTIANVLRLLNLSTDVRKMISENQISLGHAKVLLRVTDPKRQKSLANKAKNLQLSVRSLEKLVNKDIKQEKLESSLDQQEIYKLSLVEALQAEMQKLLGSKVEIDYRSGKGKMSIAFYSDDELNQMVDKFRAACTKK